MHLNASSIAWVIALLTSGYAYSGDATPIAAVHLNQKYAATLATAVKNGFGTNFSDFNTEKAHPLVAKLSGGEHDSSKLMSLLQK